MSERGKEEGKGGRREEREKGREGGRKNIRCENGMPGSKTHVLVRCLTTYLAIFSLSRGQSQRSVGVTPHMSYWRIPLLTGDPS